MTTPTTAADCEHRFVVTHGYDNGEVALWACQECKRRFYPACPTCVTVGHRDGHIEAEAAAAAREATVERISQQVGPLALKHRMDAGYLLAVQHFNAILDAEADRE